MIIPNSATGAYGRVREYTAPMNDSIFSFKVNSKLNPFPQYMKGQSLALIARKPRDDTLYSFVPHTIGAFSGHALVKTQKTLRIDTLKSQYQLIRLRSRRVSVDLIDAGVIYDVCRKICIDSSSNQLHL